MLSWWLPGCKTYICIFQKVDQKKVTILCTIFFAQMNLCYYIANCHFYDKDALRPSQQIFSHTRTISCLPGLNKYKAENSAFKVANHVVCLNGFTYLQTSNRTSQVGKIVHNFDILSQISCGEV